MQRPCSRNLHQTIAASLVSSGSITCTETIEPEEASIFGIAVRQRRSAAAAICLSALRSPRLARGFFVDFIPAGQQVEFWLRGGGGPVEVCSRRSVAVHVPRFSVRPLHEYRDSRSSGPRRRVLRPCALLRYSRPRGWSRLQLLPSRRRRDRAQVLTFRTKAWSSFAPPTCRMPLGQSQASPELIPEEGSPSGFGIA